MFRISFASLAVAMALVTAAAAQPANDVQSLGREIESLKAGQAAILKELRELKEALREDAPPPVPAAAQVAPRPANSQSPEPIDLMVDLGDAPIRGDKNAKVTVIEFTDYQCPFCSRHFRQTWPRLQLDFVQTGKARFVLRDLPIESIHPLAFKAAEATRCAQAQGKFWEMHDILFRNQSALNREDLSAHAKALGLDVSAFDKCVDSGQAEAKIRKDISDSRVADARGTPIFFIGLTDPNSNRMRATRVIRGAYGYATFKEAIEGLLSSVN